MSSSFQQTNFGDEAESFEVFDSLTEALAHIDSYDPAQNNTHVLLEAERRLQVALANDGDAQYHKAQYFQGIVSYLKGNSDEAIRRFESMSESVSSSILKDEIAYNLAAAYTDARKWQDAIKKFREVIQNTAGVEKPSQDRCELRLIAQAALAHSYAKQIVELRSQGENQKLIDEYSAQIEKQYESAQHAARQVLDRDVVKEAEQLIREAYQIVGRATATIELLPAESRRKRWKASRIFSWFAS
jgi:tetratricopeptide (TPR) repeat protein